MFCSKIPNKHENYEFQIFVVGSINKKSINELQIEHYFLNQFRLKEHVQ